jgi:hypothetical protein
MIATHKIEELTFEKNTLLLRVDGKLYRIPIDLASSKLANANDIERNLFKVSPSGYGVHWALIDEDLSIDFLLKQAI